jgi:molybdopterin-guanine dinucleotide biosynthesis protein A
VTVAAAILAGGKAQRLGGQPKGLLEVGGRRIVDRQRQALGAVFARVFIVANDPGPWRDLGMAIVPDGVPGAGPLAGLDAALGALVAGEEAVVCVAGDMPTLHPALLALLRDHPGPVVVPRPRGQPEPLCARYGRSSAPVVAAALAAGRLRMTDLCAALDAQYLDEPVLRAVDPALASFTNVNTPEELEQVRRQLGQR